MASSISYREILFYQANINPIGGELALETPHNLQNDIKANVKYVYYNVVGGAHVHLGLVLNNAQYAFILNTPFLYPTQPFPFIVPDGTTVHMNLKICIAHTKAVCIFREVTGVEQDLVQKIVSTVEEAYPADIHNWNTDSINDTVDYVLTYLQDNYGQLMPHELL